MRREWRDEPNNYEKIYNIQKRDFSFEAANALWCVCVILPSFYLIFIANKNESLRWCSTRLMLAKGECFSKAKIWTATPDRNAKQQHPTSSSSSTWPTGVGWPEGANASIRFQFHFFRCIFLVGSMILAATSGRGRCKVKSSCHTNDTEHTCETSSKLVPTSDKYVLRAVCHIQFHVLNRMRVCFVVMCVRTTVRCLCPKYYVLFLCCLRDERHHIILSLSLVRVVVSKLMRGKCSVSKQEKYWTQ